MGIGLVSFEADRIAVVPGRLPAGGADGQATEELQEEVRGDAGGAVLVVVRRGEFHDVK